MTEGIKDQKFISEQEGKPCCKVEHRILKPEDNESLEMMNPKRLSVL